jgi:hypothetical protein
MIYIGIDLSDRFFDSCITNQYGDVLNRDRFDFHHDKADSGALPGTPDRPA